MKNKNRTVSDWPRANRRAASSQINLLLHMSASVENILNYLHEAAGFTIKIKPDVPIRESDHCCTQQPENEQQAMDLLKQAMARIGCTVLQKARLLTIVTVHESKKHCLLLPRIGTA